MIGQQNLDLGGTATATIDLSSHFSDADGDTLTYTFAHHPPGKVSLGVSGAELTITAQNAGQTTIIVTATDPSGAAVAQGFFVEVAAPIDPGGPPQDPDPVDAVPGISSGELVAPRTVAHL